MNNVIKRSIFALSLISISTLTFAAKTGAYIGGGAGVSNLDTPKQMYGVEPSNDLNGFNQQTKSKRGGFGGRAFVGYNFNQYVGMELGYGHYAPSTFTYSASQRQGSDVDFVNGKTEYNLSDVDLVGKGYLPLGQSGFDLYALAGVAYVHSYAESQVNYTMNSDDTYGSEKISMTTNKIRPKYGIGAQYNIASTGITTGLELSRIQGNGSIKDSNFENHKHVIPSANMLTFNVAYNFG